MEKLGDSKSLGYITDQFIFERKFEPESFYAWLQANWNKSIWYAFLYITIVFMGQKWMNNRSKFSLRVPLALWSGCLAVFSIAGMVRTFPELIYTLRTSGFEGTICDDSYMYGPTSFWLCASVMSKLYELGDTMFIILRKQRLIFLHWYHHATVLVYAWFSVAAGTAPGRWFMVMNYSVHSIMYSYYTLRAVGLRLPKWISMSITTAQICQMMMGLGIALKVYHIQSQGRPCQFQWNDLCFCLTIYASYLVLFVYFFHQSYLQPKPKTIKKA